MNQIVYAFLMALMAMSCYILGQTLRHFRPSPLGSLPAQNFEIIENITPPDMTPKMLCASAGPNQRTIVALTPQVKPKEESM